MQRHKCGESAADQGTLPFLWRRKKIRQPFFGSAFLVHARRWKMVPQLIMTLATVCRDLGSRAVVRGERCLRSRLSHKIHPHRRRLPARRRQRHHRAHGRGQDAGELEPAGGDRLQASSRIDFDTVCERFLCRVPRPKELRRRERVRSPVYAARVGTHQVPGSCDARATRTRHSGSDGMLFFSSLVIYMASPTGFEPVLPP